MAVSVEDIKKAVTRQEYLTLTAGDDGNALRALERASLWVKGKILSTGNEFDEDNEVIKTAVITRSVYELFSFVGFESRAKQKAEDARELLESYFGNTAGGENREMNPIAGAIRVP